MAEQTSAERFEEFWQTQGLRGEANHTLDAIDLKGCARAAWDAATAAAEHDAGCGCDWIDDAKAYNWTVCRIHAPIIGAYKDKLDALRQRIAELEGR